ncbi:hypothetical protein [Acidaminococcus sp.]|uniref:hypothetical protein n=1 Tax=Acidaminococcus sp. TaxID=1872103 RepID=UPI003D7CF1B0
MEKPTAASCAGYITALTGYETTADDVTLMGICLEAEEIYMLNETALDTLPAALYPMLRDSATGRWLKAKKEAVLGSDSLQVVKSISEGDVSVSLDGSTAESRLDQLITELTREDQLLCFRKFRW